MEVLPASAWEDEHIDGAVSIPLRGLEDEAPRRLRPDRPVVVYCHDAQ